MTTLAVLLLSRYTFSVLEEPEETAVKLKASAMPLGLVSTPFCTVVEPSSSVLAAVLAELDRASADTSVPSLAGTDLLAAVPVVLSVPDWVASSPEVPPPPQAARNVAVNREASRAL